MNFPKKKLSVVLFKFCSVFRIDLKGARLLSKRVRD